MSTVTRFTKDVLPSLINILTVGPHPVLRQGKTHPLRHSQRDAVFHHATQKSSVEIIYAVSPGKLISLERQI